MKKRKTRLTEEFWAANERHMRDLQERIARLEREIAERDAARERGEQA